MLDERLWNDHTTPIDTANLSDHAFSLVQQIRTCAVQLGLIDKFGEMDILVSPKRGNAVLVSTIPTLVEQRERLRLYEFLVNEARKRLTEIEDVAVSAGLKLRQNN